MLDQFLLPSTVEALCICILGDGAAPPAGDWPPRSVAELMQQAPGAAETRSLIEQGLGALDVAVVEDTGHGFAQLERPRQLAALYRLEAGGPALSQEQAEVFVDTFLTLAAQAYLQPVLELQADAGPAGLAVAQARQASRSPRFVNPGPARR